MKDEANSITITSLESEISKLKEESEKQKLNEEANSNMIVSLCEHAPSKPQRIYALK
ncbi:22060_t:CDS:1, partial [Entrophospora sp. SA101]